MKQFKMWKAVILAGDEVFSVTFMSQESASLEEFHAGMNRNALTVRKAMDVHGRPEPVRILFSQSCVDENGVELMLMPEMGVER